MDTITPAALARRLGDSDPPALLDVREHEEHAFCALPGSRLIPLGELGIRADELADWQDREVVVYCHHGIRSAHAVGLLHRLGFAHVLNLAGGVDRWTRDVDPSFPRY
ncbi:MAG: hypothetical protein KF791_12685 [Verrucomicrobiae bacterium]|nr:hypothetical protein [Verrucomicrobiae bacterium]